MIDAIVLVPLSLLLFGFLGRRFPLRVTQGGGRRVVRNLSLGAVTYVVQRFAAIPIVYWAAEWGTEQGWAWYERLLEWPLLLRFPLGFLAADAILYGWHRMNHEVPFLWRFHRVHHSDTQMDASTAVRFHPGEYLLSVGTSLVQALVVGPQAEVWLVYEAWVSVGVVFHHSELRLPLGLERVLHWFFVTPRSHTLHHSVVRQEQDSNYGTIFSFWDRLFRTHTPIVRLGTEHDPALRVMLGVNSPPSESFASLLVSPFR